MRYIRPKREIIHKVRDEVFEWSYYKLQYEVARDTIFGIWMKNLYVPMGETPPRMEEEHLKNFYSDHLKNMVAHPKTYLTSTKYIIWN